MDARWSEGGDALCPARTSVRTHSALSPRLGVDYRHEATVKAVTFRIDAIDSNRWPNIEFSRWLVDELGSGLCDGPHPTYEIRPSRGLLRIARR